MKYLFTVLAIAFAISASAQTSKGSWLIGGSLKVERQSNKYLMFDGQTGATTTGTTSYAIFEVSPTVGYFVKDRFMLGLKFEEYRSWALTGPKNKQNAISFGPIARYYFAVAEELAVFPELAYLLTANKYTYDINGDKQTQKAKSSTIRAGVGLAWFVAPNIGIEGLLAYQNTDARNSDLGDQQQLYYSVGIQFYLPKKD